MNILLRRAGVIGVAALIVAACNASPPLPSPMATGLGPTVSPRVPSASPSATPTFLLSPSTSPLTSPSPVPTATTPLPVGTPSGSLSSVEQQLVEALRSDVRVNCVPRRVDLPPNATAGIECHVNSALVDRVGAYGFAPVGGAYSGPPEPARQAYLNRLAEYNVAPRSGDCKAGTPGDRSWPESLPDRGEDGGLSALRSGCFRDQNGRANVRLTCYGEIYVGVLGKTPDLAALYRWAWQVAPGEDTHRDPPGICARPD